MMNQGARVRANGRVAWAALRLPFALIILYALRAPLIDLIERLFDIIWITQFVIDLASTPLTRFAAFVALMGVFTAIAVFARARFGAARAYPIALAGAGVLSLAVIVGTGTGLKWLVPPLLLLATNWAPDAVLARLGLTAPRMRALIAYVPGVSEALFTDRFLAWARGRVHAAMPAAGALMAALALAATLHGGELAKVERALRAGDDVRLVDDGNLNGLSLDSSGRYLFATGHGASHLLRYDLEDLAAAPVASPEPSDGAQGLAYDPGHNEILLYRASDQAVVALDARTLALVRTIPAGELSPGDPWIIYDRITDTVTLASEADVQVGQPFVVLDRLTGAVRDVRPLDAGLLALNPNAPVLYVSFFRRGRGVLAYDIARSEIVAEGPSDARMDRLGFDPVSNEVLVPSPMESRILRYDPNTLELRGSFRVMFGVRELAIDPTRNVMLTASIATGKVAMVDMATRRVVRTWYLGPWLRTIVLSPERGRAYVSSNGALYELRYAEGLPN